MPGARPLTRYAAEFVTAQLIIDLRKDYHPSSAVDPGMANKVFVSQRLLPTGIIRDS